MRDYSLHCVGKKSCCFDGREIGIVGLNRGGMDFRVCDRGLKRGLGWRFLGFRSRCCGCLLRRRNAGVGVGRVEGGRDPREGGLRLYLWNLGFPWMLRMRWIRRRHFVLREAWKVLELDG